MIGALVYLQLTSLRNALSQRLRRLRQPRYLVGAIVGLAYFYFFFFRHFFAGHRRWPWTGRPCSSRSAHWRCSWW